MARTRAFRRYQIHIHMWRRLKEDRNQHYNDLNCPCWHDKRAMARFKEQPKQDCRCCKNERRQPHNSGFAKLTIQEAKQLEAWPLK